MSSSSSSQSAAEKFDLIYSNGIEGWSVDTRRSQIFRYLQNIKMLKTLPKNMKILEIACGTGTFTGFYLDKLFPKEIVGIDISKKALAIAKKRFPNIQFHFAQLPELSYPKESFDLITIMEVLYYLTLEEKIKTLQSCHNVLTNKGWLFVSVNIGDAPYFKYEEIQNILIKNGFEIKKIDSMYITSYYKYIETFLMSLHHRLKTLQLTVTKKQKKSHNIKISLIKNILIHNIWLLDCSIFIIEKITKHMPIGLINYISSYFPKHERSLTWLLAQKATTHPS